MVKEHFNNSSMDWQKLEKMDCIIAGVSIKPVTGGLPPPVEPLKGVCLDFINENKNDN